MANSANEMSHTLLKKFVSLEIQSGKEQEFSFLVEGPHGIGKSAFWKELCVELDGFMIDMRLGQRDLGDIIGMPYVEGSNEKARFKHILPDIIRPAFIKDLSELGVIGHPLSEDKLAHLRPADHAGRPFKFVLLFLDEYNRGTKDVMQSVFEIVYDRSMNGRRVHPSVWIAAACNDNMDVYTITEGDPAFRSRFRTIKYKPTVQEWLEWGKRTGELCEEVLHLFDIKPDLADPPTKNENNIEFLNQPHPNRRSWHYFSLWLQKHRQNFTSSEIRDICATYVGGEAAEIYRMTMENYAQLQKKRAQASSAEVKSAAEIWDNYVKFNNWMETEVAAQLASMNASQLAALADLAVDNTNAYNYMTNNARDKIISLSNLLPQEVFAQVWSRLADKAKGFLREQVTKKGNPQHFEKFELKK